MCTRPLCPHAGCQDPQRRRHLAHSTQRLRAPTRPHVHFGNNGGAACNRRTSRSVAPTTAPTEPEAAAFHASHMRATRTNNGSAPTSSLTASSCSSAEEGLDVLHSTNTPFWGYCKKGVTESLPMYAFTVAQCAPSASNAALAYAAAVVLMSPRFASSTTGMPSGMWAITCTRRHVSGEPRARSRRWATNPLQGRDPLRSQRLEECHVGFEGRGIFVG